MKTKTIKETVGKAYMSEHFDAVMNYLSFGVNVNEEQKQNRIMNGKLPFVKKTLEYSVRHPQLIPGFDTFPKANTPEMEHELKLFASDANETLTIIEESKGSVGYKAYAYAQAFAENAKKAAENNVPAASYVYRNLCKQFGQHVAR